MHELIAILRDVLSGALPMIAIPSLIIFLIRSKRRRSVRVSYFYDRSGAFPDRGVQTEDVPIVGEVDSSTGKITMH